MSEMHDCHDDLVVLDYVSTRRDHTLLPGGFPLSGPLHANPFSPRVPEVVCTIQ